MKRLPMRQWQIVMLMIQGKRPKDIARMLSIQRTTVYRHQALSENYMVCMEASNSCGQ